MPSIYASCTISTPHSHSLALLCVHLSHSQDGIRVEFEEQLPLKDYAIRVPTWLVHKLPQILEALIETGRVKKMQKVLECAWRLHW